jgi:hypothetical protein
MARDARALANLNEFGEHITYIFKDGSPNRTVLAVVDRQDLEPAAGNVQQVARLKAIVEIPNNSDTTVFGWVADDGIPRVQPGDKVLMVMRLGDVAVTARVTRVLSQDEGMFRVEVVA